MTREEAISQWVMPAIKNTWNEKKCAEIIEALEQEPCEDVISRADAILQIQRHGVGCFDPDEFSPEVCERFVIDLISKLPSYRLEYESKELCEDAISRSHALSEFKRLYFDNDTVVRCAELILGNEPPVNPQPKTGYWIYENYNWRCSECNEAPKTLGYVGTADFMAEHFKFCNHCGARMIEPQEDKE